MDKKELRKLAEEEFNYLEATKYPDWENNYWTDLDLRRELRKDLNQYTDDHTACAVIRDMMNEKQGWIRVNGHLTKKGCNDIF